MGRLTGVLGIAVILGCAYLFSTDRRAIKLKTVAWGIGLQLALGLFVLDVKSGQVLFGTLGYYAKHLLDFSYVGSEFIFGELGKANSSLGLDFRVSGFADDYIHRRIFRGFVSHRRDANHHSRAPHG